MLMLFLLALQHEVISDKPTSIDSHLYSLVIPKEILKDFILTKIDEQESVLTFTLIESEQNIPSCENGIKLVQNGYQNAVEIQGFSIMGKQCILRIIRRRWKESSSTKSDYHNTYSYAVEGTKVTPKFGDFLKGVGQLYNGVKVVLRQFW